MSANDYTRYLDSNGLLFYVSVNFCHGTTRYLHRNRVKDHRSLKSGHKTHLWCCQDSSQKKKAKPTQNPNTMHRDHVGMKRYNCQSWLVISCVKGSSDNTQTVSVQIKHHERHEEYFDVSMPPGASDIIRENIAWNTPVAIILKVQAVYPQVMGKQIHT